MIIILSASSFTKIEIVKISTHNTYSEQILSSNWFVSSLLIFGLLTGCTTPSSKQPVAAPSNSGTPVATKVSNPKVVVTNTVLCDLTRQIAASTVEVVCLMAPGSDPHIYKLTPADRQSIEDAKLVFVWWL